MLLLLLLEIKKQCKRLYMNDWLSELEEDIIDKEEPDFEMLYKFAKFQYNDARKKFPLWMDKVDDVKPYFKSFYMLYYTMMFFELIHKALKGNQQRLFNLIVYAFEMSKVNHPVHTLLEEEHEELLAKGIDITTLKEVEPTDKKTGRLYVYYDGNGKIYDVSNEPHIYSHSKHY